MRWKKVQTQWRSLSSCPSPSTTGRPAATKVSASVVARSRTPVSNRTRGDTNVNPAVNVKDLTAHAKRISQTDELGGLFQLVAEAGSWI